MGEHEPKMSLQIAGEQVEARRENTTLYTFLGQLAIYNHVFVVTKEDSERPGFYVFKDNNVFDEMADYMLKNQYPAHINLLSVAECDKNAYDNHIKSMCADIGDSVPEDWK